VELTALEAKTLGHSYLGVEHILLGLLREEHGVAAQALTSHERRSPVPHEAGMLPATRQLPGIGAKAGRDAGRALRSRGEFSIQERLRTVPG
jgi:hypothetical protein